MSNFKTVTVRHRSQLNEETGLVKLVAATTVVRPIVATYADGRVQDMCGDVWLVKEIDGKLQTIGEGNRNA